MDKNKTLESKTEFLFESDADKELIRQAQTSPKKKAYKKIILNTFIISALLTTIFITLDHYQITEISKIEASIGNIKNKVTLSEKMNSSSSYLKEVKNDYDKKYEILINKSNPITEELVKNYTLVNVDNNLYDGITLEEETYNNYLKLKENLLQRGYYINIKSGFRTLKDSQNIYNSYKSQKGINYAEKYVAKPGTSEHNTGLAFDFVISTSELATKSNYESDEYFYLENIAYLYGFIIRYPKEKETITGYNYEPWHLRYVGKTLAKYLKKNNLTLEEYYEEKE